MPKEMLTDNGRQYAVARQDQVPAGDWTKPDQHIRSRPHHPQTLGKIERFWKTIWEEFISRARFATFEEARERLRWWVQYYNHQRPHQALDGLCPADRFYRIEQAVRSEMEKGIAANVRELALHGKPQTPFYMMGRMGDQSVTIKTEEGQVKLVVEKAEDIGNEHNEHSREETESKAGGKRAGEGAGSPDGVERAVEHLAGVPGVGSELGVAERLGAEGTPGNPQGDGRGGVDIAGAGGTGPATGRSAGGTGGGEDVPAGTGGCGESSVKVNSQEEGKDDVDERAKTQIQCPGAVPCGVAGVVGAQEQEGGMPELKVGSLLAYWQEKAMEGLIAALTPREGREVAEKGPALSVSVKRLLEKKAVEQEGKQRAQARMAGIARRMAPSSAPAVTTEG